mmetsp:Transcript_31346/g.82252  ORF Transcript_31346/g.82252 Transcript_31346/m.82252 type:complete len:246 (-) Transcript_31346:91-828(-)
MPSCAASLTSRNKHELLTCGGMLLARAAGSPKNPSPSSLLTLSLVLNLTWRRWYSSRGPAGSSAHVLSHCRPASPVPPPQRASGPRRASGSSRVTCKWLAALLGPAATAASAGAAGDVVEGQAPPSAACDFGGDFAVVLGPRASPAVPVWALGFQSSSLACVSCRPAAAASSASVSCLIFWSSSGGFHFNSSVDLSQLTGVKRPNLLVPSQVWARSSFFSQTSFGAVFGAGSFWLAKLPPDLLGT